MYLLRIAKLQKAWVFIVLVITIPLVSCFPLSRVPTTPTPLVSTPSTQSALKSASSKPSAPTSLFLRTAEDYFSRGLVLFSDENFGYSAESIQYFDKAIQLNPDFIEAYYYRGLFYSKKRDDENRQKAMQDFTQILELNPSQAEAYYYRGILYYNLGNSHKAMQDFTQAIQVKSDFTEAYIWRGFIRDLIGKQQEATEDYIQVLKLYHPEQNSETERIYHPEQNSGTDSNIKLEFSTAIKSSNLIIKTNSKFAHAYYQGLAYLVLSKQKSSDEICHIRDEDEDEECYTRAKSSLTQAIKFNPNFADAYYYRGLAELLGSEASYHSKLLREEAIYDFSQAIKLNSNFTNAYYYRGIARGEVGPDYKGVLQDFTKAIKIKPRFAEAYYQRGLLYSHQGEEQRAIKDYINALRTYKPTDGKDKKSIKEYIQTLKIQPRHVKNYYKYYQRGILLRRLGDKTGATRDFTKSIKLNPKFAKAYYYRGLTTNRIEDFTQAIRLKPNFVDAYFARGMLSESHYFIKATQINPSFTQGNYPRNYTEKEFMLQSIRYNPSLYSTTGCVLDAGVLLKPVENIEDYTQVIRLNPNFSQAYSISELMRFRIEKMQDLIKGYTQNIRRNPKKGDFYYGRGVANLQLGEVKKAINDFNQAIAINPNDADSYQSRGLAHYRLKDYKRAIEDSTQAIRLNSSLADAYFIRALARYDSGDNYGAIDDSAIAIRLTPDFANAYFIQVLAFNKLEKALKKKPEAENDDEQNPNIHILGVLWPQCAGDGGSSSIQANADTYAERGRRLARKGDRQGAIKALQEAANVYRTQGNMKRYQELQQQIRQLQQ